MKSKKKKIVYCSGPLFCPEEIGGMAVIANVLEESGFDVFLPQRDGLEAYIMKFVNSPLNMNLLNERNLIDKAVFALDVFQIVKRCDYFVLNMNGRVPDEGAIAETGIAYATGKPIVIYKNDYRTAFNGMDNSMITGLASGNFVSDLKAIPKAILEAANQIDILKEKSNLINEQPPMLKETILYGEKVWQILTLIPKGKKKNDVKLTEEILKNLSLF